MIENIVSLEGMEDIAKTGTACEYPVLIKLLRGNNHINTNAV